MGYEIDEAEVAYWGRCPECQAQPGASSVIDAPVRRRRRTARAEGPTLPSTDREKNPQE
jgi:hypothetical protein